MTELKQDRRAALEELAALAEEMIGQQEPAPAPSQWQRLLLGKLTELLLNEDSRLTGTELRHLLGILPAASPPEAAPANGGELPSEFAEVVRGIYGVNLQPDALPPDDTHHEAEQARQTNAQAGIPDDSEA